MGMQRKVQRAQEKRDESAQRLAFQGAQRLIRESTYVLTVSRLKIAVAHALQEARDSETAFRRFPNKITGKSFSRALRQWRRACNYAERIVQGGGIDLKPYPTSALYGEFFARLYGRSHDDTVLYFVEEEHFRKTLRLELRK